MYKVFIENRPIIICEKNTFSLDSTILFADSITSLEKDVYPLLKKSSPKSPIIILSKDVEADFTRFFSEHKTIHAAGGIVKRKEKYLFIKRFGKWDIPKGKLDKHEDPAMGAVREIEEECGITNPIISDLICTTYHTYRDEYKKNRLTLKKIVWYAMDYDGPKELTPQTEEGIKKAKWVKISKLDKIRSNTYASILEVIDTYFDFREEDLPESR